MNNYCVNCGKSGHIFKVCPEPIISCGIICFKLNNISLSKIEKFFYNKFINIEDFNYDNINYYNKINFHRKDIKFLMIQRKNSLSYIEFLRGKYDENNLDKISSMFELMAESEIDNIKLIKSKFYDIWKNFNKYNEVITHKSNFKIINYLINWCEEQHIKHRNNKKMTVNQIKKIIVTKV